MKSGKPVLIGLVIGALVYEIKNSINFKKQIKDQVTMTQYRNRLVEFFDKEDIDKAVRDMNEYVGHGVSPSAAFEMMILGDL